MGLRKVVWLLRSRGELGIGKAVTGTAADDADAQAAPPDLEP